MLESMIALILMCLIFFGAMQLWQWAMARMFCDYSSFYAAKAYSLGYVRRTIDKAARIAAIPISGKDEYGILKLDRQDLTARLRLYMATGNAGVDFPYWDVGNNQTNLSVHPSRKSQVTLQRAPYISPELSDGFRNFLHISDKAVNPNGSTQTVIYCDDWMENE